MRMIARCFLALSVLAAFACEQPAAEEPKPDQPEVEPAKKAASIVVYSGRSESLVKPLLDKFQKDTGAELKVRYGDTASLAALLLEEGDKSPAALYIAQDAGALGALSSKGRLDKLPADVTERVPAAYRGAKGDWVGISGRARSLVYNTETVKAEDLPASVFDLVDEKWKGRVGWAPTNGSFQAFVTAMRKVAGEEAAKKWLEDMKKNEPKEYPKNSAIVRATGAGEVDVGLVNHYYLYRFLKDDPAFPAKNHYLQPGDPGSLVNIAGVGLLAHADAGAKETALGLARFLLSPEAQTHFAEKTYEYPVLEGVKVSTGLPPLTERKPPKIDLSELEDLAGTLKLLRETGAVP
jgi:iron(III) transport system substrate-binding protein